ncbi:MAG: BACON domain-containing protein [Desulfuromonadaceae bacterium]|nr:BACON domain-containing protein [Desulfuromonas sp.]MDY0185432.1 BACON domain-containing protein [Desulfuromonadaceae bacterium]
MKPNGPKKWILLGTATLLMFMVFNLSGCGSDHSHEYWGPESEPDSTSDTVTPAEPAKKYADNVSYIGDSNGTLADEIEEIFVNSFSYDGSSTDEPIFIAASRVQALSSTQQEGIRGTLSNLNPLVLVHGNAEQINALLDILGLEQNFILPEGLPEDKNYAELFAIDQEDDGSIFIWAMYPPSDGTSEHYPPTPPTESFPAPLPDLTIDSASEQLRRTDMLRIWVDDSGKRITETLGEDRQEAMRALTAAATADSAGELTQLAKAFVVTHNVSYGKNYYQLTYYIYSCHSFNEADATDYDWFYVRQEGMLNASGEYTNPEKRGNREYVGNYVGSYTMDNWMEGLTSKGSGVALMTAKPENINNVASVTSGIDWQIGGSVGFDSSGATGSVSGGVTISNSTTVNVSDCEIINNSANAVNNAKWDYEFKKPVQTTYFAYTSITNPPLLSHSNFQPVNQWIWKLAPAIRTANRNSFSSKFEMEMYSTQGGEPFAFWIANPIEHYYRLTSPWTFNVPLSFPPLLVAPHDINFGAAGQSKPLDISVARSWTAASDQDWCEVDPANNTGNNSRINITVAPNTTGKNRSAVITYKTVDGNGSDTTTIFQSQY